MHTTRQSLALLFIICAAALPAAAQQEKLIKCISGDCQNGTGKAELQISDYGTSLVTYEGGFKNGLMDGQGKYRSGDGTRIGDGYYTGAVERGMRHGYGVAVGQKFVDGNYQPDSSTATIGLWEENQFVKCIRVSAQGEKTFYTPPPHGRSFSNFNTEKRIKDKWMNEQADAYLATRAGKFAPPAETTQVLATRKIPVARDRWSECVTNWSCLTDRKYWIDIESQAKYHAMPFGGHVTMQVVAADNTVAFEAEAGTYWTPRTEGKYTFQIKFYQDKILGDQAGHSNYVDGMQLQWWLKSFRNK